MKICIGTCAHVPHNTQCLLQDSTVCEGELTKVHAVKLSSGKSMPTSVGIQCKRSGEIQLRACKMVKGLQTNQAERLPIAFYR